MSVLDSKIKKVLEDRSEVFTNHVGEKTHGFNREDDSPHRC
jgi:hypothetical protein